MLGSPVKVNLKRSAAERTDQQRRKFAKGQKARFIDLRQLEDRFKPALDLPCPPVGTFVKSNRSSASSPVRNHSEPRPGKSGSLNLHLRTATFPFVLSYSLDSTERERKGSYGGKDHPGRRSWFWVEAFSQHTPATGYGSSQAHRSRRPNRRCSGTGTLTPSTDASLFDKLSQALEAVGVPGVVVISVPIHLHAVIATEALRAGADVLLEKPPFARMADFQALLGVEKETG